MGQFQRIFARSEVVPAVEHLQNELRQINPEVTAHVEGDVANWYRIEWTVGAGEPLILERYLAAEEGVRAELNSWAAVLELCERSPNHVALMERTIQSKQLFILAQPGDHPPHLHLNPVSEALCHLLAELADGFYQVDEKGFFEADGSLLIAEE